MVCGQAVDAPSSISSAHVQIVDVLIDRVWVKCRTHPIFVAQVRWAGGREACAHFGVCLECREHDGSRRVQVSRHIRLHVPDYLCSTLLLRCFSDCARCGKFGVPFYWTFVFRCVLASLWQGFGPLFEGFVVRVHREVLA